MDSAGARQIAAALARNGGAAATAPQVADATVAAWHVIDGALNPIIGQRGVAALYQRSLHLNRQGHPWLPAATEALQASLDTAALKSALARQDAAAAATAAGAVLQTFHELLAALVGPSLTDRLLRSVWAGFLSGSPTQDT
ncbi:MAG: hypothetical protein ABI433_01780 [Burkholderiaceae bacterium]